MTNPPVEPHPVDALMSTDGVMAKVIEVVTPVIVTVAADALHALPEIAVVAFVKVVSLTVQAAAAFVPGLADPVPPFPTGRVPDTAAVKGISPFASFGEMIAPTAFAPEDAAG